MGKKIIIVEEHGKTPTVFPPAVERCKIQISWGDLAIYRWNHFAEEVIFKEMTQLNLGAWSHGTL